MGPGLPLKCLDRGFPGSFLSSGQMQIRWCFKQTEAASDLKGIHSLWALIFTWSYNQQISKTIKLHCNVFLYVCVGISLWGFSPVMSWYLKTGQSTTAVLSTVLHHVRPQIASKYNNLITTNAYILLLPLLRLVQCTSCLKEETNYFYTWFALSYISVSFRCRRFAAQWARTAGKDLAT